MKKDSVVLIDDLHVNLLTVRGVVCAVRGASLEVKTGEIHGLVGESGCGKTMTSKSILRLHDEKRMLYKGKIYLRAADNNVLDVLSLSNRELKKMRGQQAAMIFQDPVVSLNPLFPIGGQMDEMILAHSSSTKKQAREQILRLLEEVGIRPPGERYHQYPFEFSGGMLQRIMIALSMSCRPKLLIADECTTALDVTTQAQILELMKELQRSNDTSILFITHNFGVVAEICDRASVMYAGKIIETSTVEELFDHPLHPYTQALIKSIPKSGRPGERLETIPGAPPNLLKPIKGCSFADRCPFKAKQCETEDPPMVMAAPEHSCACHRVKPVQGFSYDWLAEGRNCAYHRVKPAKRD